jgi:hypothetical protein
MIEILVAVISAVGGLFLFRALSKASASQGQKELEVKVAVLEEKANTIIAGQAQKDKETEGKVNEITKEQDKPISTSSLVDWFNKRKR